MLHLLDESLEAFLRATVPLGKREVDVSFAAPDRDWAARVGNGRPMRRPPLPRVDCRYLVTAWTSEVQDEHSLLGHTLAALLLHDTIDERYLQGSFARVRPIPTIEVAGSDGRDNSDFWSALGGQLKPGLDVVVTATVDAATLVAVGPPVDRYTIRAWRKVDEDPAEPGDAVSVDGAVRGQVPETGPIELPDR